MSEQSPSGEYLVISRGQWDSSLSWDDIEKAIDHFYTWYDRLVPEGKSGAGSGSSMKVGRFLRKMS
jgi:hypothetical protein